MVTCFQLVSTVIIYISSIVKNLQIGTTYKNYFLASGKGNSFNGNIKTPLLHIFVYKFNSHISVIYEF